MCLLLAACQPVAIALPLPPAADARTALLGVARSANRSPYAELLAIDPTSDGAAEALAGFELGTGESPLRVDVLYYRPPPEELGFVRRGVTYKPGGLELPPTRCVFSATVAVDRDVVWLPRAALPVEATTFLGDQAAPVTTPAEGPPCD